MRENPNHPELLLREHVTKEVINGKSRSIPLLIMIANREGYLWLSEFFKQRANACDQLKYSGGPQPDPDDHVHVETNDVPFNSALSDRISLRFGHLTRANRNDVLEKYEINEKTAQHADVKVRYARLSKLSE